MKAHGLMFHHFYSDDHPRGQGAINADDFTKIVEYIGIDSILPADKWVDKVVSNGLSDDHRCITFDDNLRCQYDVAQPVMEKLGIKAFWFVYTSPFTGADQRLEVYKNFRDAYFDNIDSFYKAFFESVKLTDLSSKVDKNKRLFVPEKYLQEFSFYSDSDRLFRYVRDEVLNENEYFYVMDAMLDAYNVDYNEVVSGLFMSEEHIRKLHSEGHMIGLHSHTHPTRIENLSYQGQLEEYQNNFDILKEILGEKPRVMSHPCNSYNDDTVRVMQQLGVDIGFRSNLAEVANRSRLEIPREDHANIMKKLGA